jgi:hypothetical protein
LRYEVFNKRYFMSAESFQSEKGSGESKPSELGSRMSEAVTRIRSVELTTAERRIISPSAFRVE